MKQKPRKEYVTKRVELTATKLSNAKSFHIPKDKYEDKHRVITRNFT